MDWPSTSQVVGIGVRGLLSHTPSLEGAACFFPPILPQAGAGQPGGGAAGQDPVYLLERIFCPFISHLQVTGER